jgi:predicted  nucleic acid-binding Zn-ribbon protein
MEANGSEGPSLSVLESVRCLECGFVYAKPTGGGTAAKNPGCPECGYVGWLAVSIPFRAPEERRRSAGGPLRGQFG